MSCHTFEERRGYARKYVMSEERINSNTSCHKNERINSNTRMLSIVHSLTPHPDVAHIYKRHAHGEHCMHTKNILSCARSFSSRYDMGWLRLVGSLELWVSFAKDFYKRDYILQKRPIILRSLQIIANPYHMQTSCIRLNHRSLLQKFLSFMGLFCKRDL